MGKTWKISKYFSILRNLQLLLTYQWLVFQYYEIFMAFLAVILNTATILTFWVYFYKQCFVFSASLKEKKITCRCSRIVRGCTERHFNFLQYSTVFRRPNYINWGMYIGGRCSFFWSLDFIKPLFNIFL
jgi:hypothetical protein